MIGAHNKLASMQNQFIRKQGIRDRIKKECLTISDTLAHTDAELHQYQSAQMIINTVAQQTQDELVYHISGLVSMAMESVWEINPYTLSIEFPIKRNRTECELEFVRNGHKIPPMEAVGGGARDVACFALRVGLWSLVRPKLRNLFVLDQPFSDMDLDIQYKAGQMMKEIAEKLGIQIIMVTHSPDLIKAADRVFRTKLVNDVTEVEVIEIN